MNLKTKKIIATEFLILMGLLLSALIFWMILIGWNTWIESKSDEIGEKINLIEQDIQLITSKYEIDYDQYGIPIKPSSKWIPPDDAIVEEFDFSDIVDQPGILIKKRKPADTTIDSLNNLTKELHSQKNNLNQLISLAQSNASNEFSSVVTFLTVVALIAYPLRFLIFSIRWSVRTLKSTDSD